MAFKDLRDFINLLEREGELKRISAEVDSYLEVTEISDRTLKKGGPALLFENIKGSSICLLYTSPSPRDRTRSRMPSSA